MCALRREGKEKMTEAQRVKDFLSKEGNNEDLFSILVAAINLERRLYKRQDTIKALFRLRKSLEGVFGQDLPEVDEWGNDVKIE